MLKKLIGRLFMMLNIHWVKRKMLSQNAVISTSQA